MHIPVLLNEVIEGLNLKKGAKVVDCTLGDGGHSQVILEKIGESGKLLSIDTDKENIKRAKVKLPEVILVNDNFVNLAKILEKNNFGKVDAILMDLGWSTTQFEESGRGFSFQKPNEPLDMRLGGNGITAAEVLNTWTEADLGQIFRMYGEEEKWKQIAEQIFERRKKKKFEIVDDILDIVGRENRGRLHPATKVFQALRIVVNEELKVLKDVLPQAVEALNQNGRLAVISFHSLEDRIVKNFFQDYAIKKQLAIITKKPITATEVELSKNPKSRSAKLRIAEKL